MFTRSGLPKKFVAGYIIVTIIGINRVVKNKALLESTSSWSFTLEHLFFNQHSSQNGWSSSDIGSAFAPSKSPIEYHECGGFEQQISEHCDRVHSNLKNC